MTRIPPLYSRLLFFIFQSILVPCCGYDCVKRILDGGVMARQSEK